MPEFSTIVIFSAACFALAVTPGPDMLLIASRSISQGRSAGFATLGGIQVGTYCHALAAALGLSQLFLAVPIAYDIVRFLGAAYLLYLAWRAFRVKPSFDVQHTDVRRRSLIRIFSSGFVTNIFNPKMALFVLALFPQFVTPESGAVTIQFLLLATVLNAIGLIVNGGVVLFVDQIKYRSPRSPRFNRLPHILLGGVFVGLACRLALSDRS